MRRPVYKNIGSRKLQLLKVVSRDNAAAVNRPSVWVGLESQPDLSRRRHQSLHNLNSGQLLNVCLRAGQTKHSSAAQTPAHEGEGALW
jgi:hypothetical protein